MDIELTAGIRAPSQTGTARYYRDTAESPQSP